MTHAANISEIFSSLQGEGPYTGDPMTFVRFTSCDMNCAWCDTQYAAQMHHNCRVTSADGLDVQEIPNPITATMLNRFLDSYDTKTVSVTGGEPLGQAVFLREWLPSIKHRCKILLETNGVRTQELAMLVDQVDVVSMDIKLPSSAGCQPLWHEHEQFMRIALTAGREVYTKIVVTEKTTDKDVQEAIKLISRINKFIPVFIQPASQTLAFNDVISQQRLASIDRLCRAYLPDVRVQEQMHKKWGIQ